MSIFTFIEGGYGNNFDDAFFIEVAYFPIRLIVVYFNYFKLTPNFLMKGKIRAYILFTLISVVTGSFLHRLAMHHYINALIFPDWEQGSFWQAYRFIQSGMIITSPMIFLIGLTVVYRLIDSQKKLAEISEERTKAELQFLKSQINPHFFFNTLNNLFGLALAKSDKTAEVVMKLSELMSYMLYETRRQYVTLTKEINYIKNYIELEEVRFGGRFTCDLNITGDTQLNIPPMLLLPFVENAFKHGVHTSSEGAWIKVVLEVDEHQLNFKVENSIGDREEGKKGGLGIANVKRRLALLFPEKHKLKIEDQDNQYYISLTVDLEK